MWCRSLIAILSLVLCISIGAQEGTLPPQVPETDFTGQPTYKVVRVSDGDTVYLLMDGKSTRVRLIGVETPETKHPEKPVQPYGARHRRS